MTALNDITNSAALTAVRMTDNIIKDAMPEGAQIADLSCSEFQNGVQIFSYKGMPFVELHPLKIEMDGLTLRWSRQYRKL